MSRQKIYAVVTEDNSNYLKFSNFLVMENRAKFLINVLNEI